MIAVRQHRKGSDVFIIRFTTLSGNSARSHDIKLTLPGGERTRGANRGLPGKINFQKTRRVRTKPTDQHRSSPFQTPPEQFVRNSVSLHARVSHFFFFLFLSPFLVYPVTSLSYQWVPRNENGTGTSIDAAKIVEVTGVKSVPLHGPRSCFSRKGKKNKKISIPRLRILES